MNLYYNYINTLKMMIIEDHNKIVRQVIYKNMTDKIKIVKNIEEFGSFKYGIYTQSIENYSIII